MSSEGKETTNPSQNANVADDDNDDDNDDNDDDDDDDASCD